MVEINNLTTVVIERKFLEKVAKKVLAGENKKKKNLSIAFVGEKRIRKLNKKYRSKDKSTDVLAFGRSRKFPVIPEKELRIGEVIICLQKVKKNAKKYSLTFKKESARVLIHGILHLLGYEHEKGGNKAKEMEEKEEKYFGQVFLEK